MTAEKKLISLTRKPKDKLIRHYILRSLYSCGRAPNAKELMDEFSLGMEKVVKYLDILESERHIYRVPGTQNIQMALPFSNITTHYKVFTDSGENFFCNGAIDALGIGAAFPGKRINISSYCLHCGEGYRVIIDKGKIVSASPSNIRVYIGRPAYLWLESLVRTCGSINFYTSKKHLPVSHTSKTCLPGRFIDLEQAFSIGKIINEYRFDIKYERPSSSSFNSLFKILGLTDTFWQDPH